jgi:hypothetical protein
MKCPRLVPALFCVVLLGGHARGAEPFDVEKGAVSAAASTGASIIGIDARCTFLRTHSENACPSWPINLANLGLKAGDLIRLDVLDDFSFSGGELPDEVKQMIGVFSSSATLLPGDRLNRVAGAIDAGVDVLTAPTLVGGRDTDITQDFSISSLKIRIPAGARYLFVAAPDIFNSDNIDPDANYAVRIAVF